MDRLMLRQGIARIGLRGLLEMRGPLHRCTDGASQRDDRLVARSGKDEGDVFSTTADAIWRRFASLAKMIDTGDPSVGLPPITAGLSAARQPL